MWLCELEQESNVSNNLKYFWLKLQESGVNKNQCKVGEDQTKI